jgi:hypothetical protein
LRLYQAAACGAECFTFDAPFEVYAERSGALHFGHVVINTGQEDHGGAPPRLCVRGPVADVLTTFVEEALRMKAREVAARLARWRAAAWRVLRSTSCLLLLCASICMLLIYRHL